MPALSKSTNGNFHSALGQRIERSVSWAGGVALTNTLRSHGEGSRRFLRDGLSIGIVVFRKANSRTRWSLDGHVVLDKVGASTSAPLDLIVVPPSCEYQGYGYGSTQGLWLFVDPQEPLADEQAECFTEKPMTDSTWSKDPLSRAIVSEIVRECSNGGLRGPMFLEESTMLLIMQLGHHFRGAQKSRSATHALCGSELRIIIDYIESNLSRNITLSEVSALVELTPKYFCAAFKQATGISPHQFQIGLRIDRAKLLLRDSTLSLANVASAVGFRSQSHLSHCFRRKIGIAPAYYRTEMPLRGSLLGDSESAI